MTKTKYREIDVRKQRNMTLKETFVLCISGVKHRLLRSVLTLAVVILAVAFFMFLLAESMFLRATARGVIGEVQEMRFSQQTLTWLFTPVTDGVAMRRLSDAYKTLDSEKLAEFARVSGGGSAALEGADDIATLAEAADKERIYTDWLAGIPLGKRTILVHKNTGRNAIRFILNDVEEFHARIRPMVDLRIPGKLEGMDAFLKGFDEYAGNLAAFTAAWNAKIAAATDVMTAAKAATPELSDAAWIIRADDAALEAWREKIVALGFTLSADTVAFMKKQLAEDDEFARVFAMLNDRDIRTEWSREFRETPKTRSTPEKKLLQLNDARARKIMTKHFDAGTLDRVAAKAKQNAQIAKLEHKLAGAVSEDSMFLGLSGRQFFLMAISFLVCMVGIANAMLMSITERFREIATMKCLGATDRYILVQFMMEAAMQGFFGGLFGVIIGFVIAFLRGWVSYGGHLFVYWPGVDLILSAIFSLFAGVLLAALASIQPSWSASRMAPMEAMRVE